MFYFTCKQILYIDFTFPAGNRLWYNIIYHDFNIYLRSLSYECEKIQIRRFIVCFVEVYHVYALHFPIAFMDFGEFTFSQLNSY